MEKSARWAFLVLLGILAYLSYLVVEPFISYLLLSIVLVMLFRPVYRWLVDRLGKEWLASLILVVALIILLVVPSILIGTRLVRSAPAAYESFVSNVNLEPAEDVVEVLGISWDTNLLLAQSAQRFRSYIVSNAASFVSGATGVVIGLFLMFFVMYYLFTQGDEILRRARSVVPLSQQHQDRFLREVDQVVHGTIEGQLVTGLIQGVLGGLLFAAVGIDNALFWGFIMVIFSVIPFLGSFVVWAPAAIWLLLMGSFVPAVVLMIGGLIISQIDNFLRPYIVGRYAEVHPALVLIGVLGGLAAFGFIGFVVGPLILAMLVALLRFYREDLA